MMCCDLGVELFCARSVAHENKYDLLFVSEARKQYCLLTQADPFFAIEITSRASFDALLGGLEKLGFEQRKTF